MKPRRNGPPRPLCSAVIVAGGSSSRMGEDKLLMQLRGRSVIERSLLAFEESEYIDEIVVATRSGSERSSCQPFFAATASRHAPKPRSSSSYTSARVSSKTSLPTTPTSAAPCST